MGVSRWVWVARSLGLQETVDKTLSTIEEWSAQWKALSLTLLDYIDAIAVFALVFAT